MGEGSTMQMKIGMLVLLSALCFQATLGLRDDVHEFFNDMDKNKDGVVGRSELSDWLRNDHVDRIGVDKYEESDAKELFKELDSNRNGKLTISEVEAMTVLAEHKSEEEEEDLFQEDEYSDSVETELDQMSASYY